MKTKFALFIISTILILSSISSISSSNIIINDKPILSESKLNNKFLEKEIINLNSGTVSYCQRYIVIVKGPAGGSYLYKCFTGDVQDVYDTLTQYYDFSDEEIIVLFTEENYAPHEKFDPSIVDYESTESILKDVLNMFKSGGELELGEDDLFLLFWISHGGNSGGNTFFETHGGDVFDYELGQYIEGILGTNVYVLQPCHSGGFVKEISNHSRIVITSVSENEMEGGWTGMFWFGLRGLADDDPEIGNQDGLVSFEEAYHYAARHLYENHGKHSMLDDNGDKIGHHYTNSEYDINDPSKDGYIAARTFLIKGKLISDPNGPYFGLIDIELQFTGSATGGLQPYNWLWDFGDGNTSKNQNPKHMYKNSGNYSITLTVIDNSSNSSSASTYAWIQDCNIPPDKPSIEGPTNCKVSNLYDYNFIVNDTDKSIIFLFVDWDDGSNSGWLGPYDSGQETILNHTWSKKKNYIIKCKAKDPYSAESNWSEFEVNIPRYRVSYTLLFNWLIKHFPMMQRLFFLINLKYRNTDYLF